MRTETATRESISLSLTALSFAALSDSPSDARSDAVVKAHSPPSASATRDQTVPREDASPLTQNPDARPNVGFIGAGALATTLALALSAAGWKVDAVASRSHSSAQRLAQLIPGCRAETDPQAVVNRCRLVFLTVPDDSISQVAASLYWPEDRAVVHCCGAATSDILSPAAISGALCGSFHPLQTFPSLSASETPESYAPARFRGITFAVEGTGWVRQALELMASDLGGRTIHVSPEHRPLYHASAVMSCGALVALLRSAAALWQEMGVDSDTALHSILPLARATLDNTAPLSPEAATTGPVIRGDVDTVRLHLQALKASASQVLPLYVQLTKAMIPLSSAFDAQKLREIQHLLAEFEEPTHLSQTETARNLQPANQLSPPGPNPNDGGPRHA